MGRHNTRRLFVLLLLLVGLIVSVTQVFKTSSYRKGLPIARSFGSQDNGNEFEQINLNGLEPGTTADSNRGENPAPRLSDDQGAMTYLSEPEDFKFGFDHREIFSLSTIDRTFMPIHFGLSSGYNPNVIPHPTQHDLWIVVAQQANFDQQGYTAELTCSAMMFNERLICTMEAKPLPIAPSVLGKCEDDLLFINLVAGPRDARVFHGPEIPYIVYGSLSQFYCFGQWIQDARMLLDEYSFMRHTQPQFCANPVEIQRAKDSVPASRPVEKNHFLFWDTMGQVYVHYDLWPKRSFAPLDIVGTGLAEQAPFSASSDQICMAKYFPKIAESNEDIHQATNSLSITMCPRASAACKPTDDNTFIMHIFHHKIFHDFHETYEPYVILFRRTAPFALHAISQRPLWIAGRKELTIETDAVKYRDDPDSIPKNHTEMFYITSMSWKTHGQKYQGYTDDVLFINFGIENSRSGVIDVKAADILQDLAYC